MNNSLSALLLFLLLSVVTFDSSAAVPRVPEGQARDDDNITAVLSAFIRQEIAQKHIPATSIALVDGDRIIWSEGFGMADPENGTRATADTVYRVGSVSKLFTDMAIMQLVEQGRLDLDSAIETYLPGFHPYNPYPVPVTLRNIMSHRSGIVREPPIGNYFDPTEPSASAVVESMNDTSIVYEPGTRMKYSNAAITVAGYLVEKTAGKPFAPYIQERLLTPLGMDSSAFQLTPGLKNRLARSWMWSDHGQRFPAPTFALGTLSAGNLYSTVNDLSNLLIALFHNGRLSQNTILKPGTLAAMLSPVDSRADADGEFALGFYLSKLDGQRVIGHSGDVYGFSTQLKGLPDARLGVVAVATLDGSGGYVERLANYALRLLLAKKQGQPLPAIDHTHAIPPDLARRLDGLYRHGDELIRFSNRTDRLLLRHGTQLQEVRALDDDRLIIDDVSGYGPAITVQSADQVIFNSKTWQRVTDSRPADAPLRWQGLIGEYGWDHDILYVYEDRGRLYALIEWFYYYPLTEISRDQYAFPDDGLYQGEKLIFHRDENDVTTDVTAAGIAFKRINEVPDNTPLRIKPVKPLAELRKSALAAQPPNNQNHYRQPDLVEPAKLDTGIKLDIRYAGKNNVFGAVFYGQARAFMQRPAAQALVRANQQLRKNGLGLLIYDAYRPWFVSKIFADAVPPDIRYFAADPQKGSPHNRGCAVDLTLYDLDSGKPVDMVTSYDEYTTRSGPDYPGGTALQRWYRSQLRKALEAQGFAVNDYQWWHFDFYTWPEYPVLNTPLEEIADTHHRGDIPGT